MNKWLVAIVQQGLILPSMTVPYEKAKADTEYTNPQNKRLCACTCDVVQRTHDMGCDSDVVSGVHMGDIGVI